MSATTGEREKKKRKKKRKGKKKDIFLHDVASS